MRRALGGERIETQGSAYRVRLNPGELDLDQFEQFVQRAQSAMQDGAPALAAEDLRAALALRRGPVLAELEELPFVAARALLERRVVEAIELLAEAEIALGRHDAVIGELEEAIAAHPFRERLREHHVLGLYRAGRPRDALAAYQSARAALDEVGLVPGPALRELERAILSHDQSFEAARAAPAEVRVSIPVAPTPLIGRETELVRLTTLVRQRDVRLVTLTGPGGIGKTRLAIAVAHAVADELVDGATFVDLAALTDPTRIADAVAAALGVAEDATTSYLAQRSLLLVFDNFEHLLDGAEIVATLLAAAPRLRVLATSRTALRLTGEHEFPVAALPVPHRSLPTYESLRDNDAVRLFVDRARSVDPTFELTHANTAFVAEICRALDGLPLAIELAAARTRIFAPEDIVARLNQSLDLLADGARDRPFRQQTLRATLDWSYRLLSEPARSAFVTLGVFSGGFSLAAATAVLDRDDALLALLLPLVEASLVRRLPRAVGVRFGMLETVRAFAQEKLSADGGEQGVQLRHAEHVLAWAESAAERIASLDESAAVLDQLDEDIDNARIALATFASRGEMLSYARLVLALSQYWIVRGHLAEGRRCFERVYATVDEPATRAAALVRGAVIPYRQGKLEEAKLRWREALELYEQLNDDSGRARTLGELGAVAVLERELDDAAAAYEQCRLIFSGLGDQVRLGICLANLAAIEDLRGNSGSAAAYGEEAISLQRGLNDVDGLTLSLQNLARVYSAVGRTDEARALLKESIDNAMQLGYRELLGYGFLAAAELALAEDPVTAAQLLGATAEVFASVGAEIQDAERESFDRIQANLKATLGHDASAAAQSEGRTLPLERLVSLATAGP
ncbi:MAG: hypothetical protein H0X39_06420 [Actinobacteria bacterium]|nr:hypothetical protein [Actinomycetota bacterium]